MEDAHLIRMDFLDQANLFRIAERIQGVDRASSDSNAMRGMLAGAQGAIVGARAQVKRMQILQKESKQLGLSLRELNRFFTAVMEGRARKGQEEFSQFLIARVHETLEIPAELEQLLELYISLEYRIRIKRG
jgi:hypothetical protein